jgi:DNA-binding beta-propeller fold protein YncE
LPGIATIIDYAGDTIMATQPIGVGPVAFAVNSAGSNGYTINSDKTLTTFPISSSLQAKNVLYSTLPSNAQPVGLFYPRTGLWAADLISTGNVVDVFSGGSGVAATFSLAIPVTPTPMMVIGSGSGGLRYFTLSQGSVSSALTCNAAPTTAPLGWVTPIEISSDTADTPIQVGKCPVYAVVSSDANRVFVLNRGSDTISVINAQDNTLDSCTPFPSQSGQTVTCHPTLPLSTTALAATGITPPNCNLATDPTCGGMPTTAGPVYAEYNAATSQLVVANYDGGTISIIDVSLDEYGNDSATFGTTYTVKVGNNPASVTALYDGSRAYTANQTDGTVSIVNLSSHTVEKSALPVIGHPRTVVSTQNSEEGKVYVASPDSNYLTIISTTTDLVDTAVLIEGNVLDVRVSNQSGVSSNGNSNIVSRIPGFGQPCNLPLSEFNPVASSTPTLANCQAQDPALLQ